MLVQPKGTLGYSGLSQKRCKGWIKLVDPSILNYVVKVNQPINHKEVKNGKTNN